MQSQQGPEFLVLRFNVSILKFLMLSLNLCFVKERWIGQGSTHMSREAINVHHMCQPMVLATLPIHSSRNAHEQRILVDPLCVGVQENAKWHEIAVLCLKLSKWACRQPKRLCFPFEPEFSSNAERRQKSSKKHNHFLLLLLLYTSHPHMLKMMGPKEREGQGDL